MAKTRKPSVSGIVVPMFIETNGRMEKLMEVVKDKKVQKEYKFLMKKLEANPMNFSRKLREAVWKGKTLDEIAAKLHQGKNK